MMMAETKDNPLLTAALLYASRNWPVVPLHTPIFKAGVAYKCSCNKSTCVPGVGPVGKHPRTINGLKGASIDPAQIRKWWSQWPDANIAIVTGNGIAVIDIDVKKNGTENWAALVEAHEKLPDTPEAITGGGGKHIIFKVDVPIKSSVSEIAKGVDVRGEGGYICAAPSLHVSGKRYEWELSSDPVNVPLAMMVKWLVALTAKRATAPGPMPAGEDGKIGEGQRNDFLFKFGRSMRSKGAEHPAILAALIAMNDSQCNPPMDPKEVEIIAAQVAKVPIGLSEEAKDKAKKAEARAKKADDKVAAINERVQRGKAKANEARAHLRLVTNDPPRSTPPPPMAGNGGAAAAAGAPPGAHPGAPPNVPPGAPPAGGAPPGGPEEFDLNRGDAVELGACLLRRLRDGSPEKVIYDRNDFWRYESTTGMWASIANDVVYREIALFAGLMVNEKPLKLSHADMTGAIAAARNFATFDFFNNAPTGILFHNGFVTVHNGEIKLLPHSPVHRAQYRLDYDYDPLFIPTRWLRFLEEVFTFPFEDQMPQEARDLLAEDRLARIAFLQEHAGACLLGEATKYQTCAVLVGDTGNNGKSVYLKLIKALFPRGSVTSVSPQDWSNKFYLAELAGARLNAVAELPEREVSESESFKSVITGDSITVARKHQRPFDLIPKAGQLFACNDLPSTRDQSEGFFRRFCVVPFDREFKESERDADLANKIIATEMPGIAVWAIQGLARLQLRGNYLHALSSQHVKQQWQVDSDQVRQWLNECTQEGGTMNPSRAYESYAYWARKTGHGNLTQQKFCRRLSKVFKGLRIEQKHVENERVYPRGILPEWIPRDGYGYRP